MNLTFEERDYLLKLLHEHLVYYESLTSGKNPSAKNKKLCHLLQSIVAKLRDPDQLLFNADA
jgi:hypothetical protein